MMVTQTDLLNAVSHEFNTPLSSIKLGGQTLMKIKEYKDFGIVDQIAKSILKQQKYLQELVDQILVLGMSESQDSILEDAIFLTDEWLGDIINEWMEDKDETEVLVEFKGVSNDSKAMVDPYLFRLSLFNILDNALKYRKNHPVHIQIQGRFTGKKLHIEIQDNGLGMTAQDVENAFKKFYRGKHKYNSKKPGLGLGLYLVNQIIKLHKGSCKIESKLRKGTKIIITLPVYYG